MSNHWLVHTKLIYSLSTVIKKLKIKKTKQKNWPIQRKTLPLAEMAARSVGGVHRAINAHRESSRSCIQTVQRQARQAPLPRRKNKLAPDFGLLSKSKGHKKNRTKKRINHICMVNIRSFLVWKRHNSCDNKGINSESQLFSVTAIIHPKATSNRVPEVRTKTTLVRAMPGNRFEKYPVPVPS